ncbi:ABC transporter substrate-binding protein [Consotaella aegiceratis]|uniref:ABC transporter substrate-binding protein n=1 Tax=Consotaella aegiceratis TaxID=3097961 RepID=UPI002F3FA737
MKIQSLAVSAAVGAFLLGTSTADAQQVEIWCDSEDAFCGSLDPALQRFNEQNPDTTVNLQRVSYQTILESMPVQIQSGEGPDGAFVTDLGGLSDFYVDLTPYVDAERFRADYGQTLGWLRGLHQDSDAIYGLPTALTVNGLYVDLTLFEQAGVPVPEDGATWEEWAEAARQVAKATGTPIPMEMDRSGHRFASLAISYGAEMVGEDGRPVVDEGLRKAIEQFVAWHRDGTMPMDLWGAVGGATHRELFQDFLNAEAVLYFSGSWTLNRLDREVADLFDWKVAPAPCGPSSCTLMPGGGALVAFKNSKHPEVVGKFIDYLSQPEVMSEILENSVQIPAAKSLQDSGLEYSGASERTQQAQATFIAQIPKMADAAYRFQGWRFERAMMNSLTTRISQVLNEELDVDAALARIEQDVNLAIDAAQSN